MNKNRKMLPMILLIALVLSTGQALVLSVQGGESRASAALAEEQGPPVFLPVVVMRSVPDSIFGIDLGAISPQNGLNEMVQAGSKWVRRGSFLWPSVEPSKGDRKWEAVPNFESEMIAAHANGLKTILVIQNAPGWALTDPAIPCGTVKSQEFSALASFVHDVVARYSQAPYHVQYYEIFNEPDSPYLGSKDQNWGCWGNEDDTTYYGGDTYGEMLKVVYPQVKAANSDAKVVLGGLLMDCNPKKENCAMTKFLEGLLSAGAGNSFDVLSFHTYDYYYEGYQGQYGNPNWDTQWDTSGPAINAKVEYIKNTLAKYHVPNKPLFATELALLCTNNCGADFETSKAGFLAQNYVYALIHGVQSGIWYDVFGGWKNNGLLAKDLTPLPAFHAYQTAQDKLGGAVFVREVTGYSNLKVYEFNKGDRLLWVLWSTKAEAQKINFPRQPLGAWDNQGASLGTPSSTNVSNIPIYVELSK